MIRIVSANDLGGFSAPGITVRDHFRGTPENYGTSRYMLGPLRVLADTAIDPYSGFPEHAHCEMEIVSYVSTGVLTHGDTMGNTGRLAPGDMQIMTTGTGMRHSEVNDGATPVRMYQMWFLPDSAGLAPRYEDVTDPRRGEAGVLCTLLSGVPDRPGAARINTGAVILGVDLRAGQSVTHEIAPGRHTYVLAAAGRIALEDLEMTARDGAQVDGFDSITIAALEDSDVLLIDFP